MKDSITLANEIAKVKEDIRKAISNRGVEITETTRFADYPAKIMSIDTQNQAEDVYFRDPNLDTDAPEIPGNYGVVAEYALANSNISEAYLNNVTTVLTGSFSDNPDLNYVDGKKVKYIGTNAFANCGFETIDSSSEMPNLKVIGTGAYSSNKNLSEVYVDSVENIQSGAFANNFNLTWAESTNCKKIGSFCFADCVRLDTLKFDNVESFGEYATYNCGNNAASLSDEGNSLFLPKTKHLSDYNFYNSLWINSIDLPECEFIGDYSFYIQTTEDKYLKMLKNINLPKVKYIGQFCFNAYKNTQQYYGNFGDINLPQCTYIGRYSFNKLRYTKPDRVLTISNDGCVVGDSCFADAAYAGNNGEYTNTPTIIRGRLVSVGYNSFNFYSTAYSTNPTNIDIDFSTIQYIKFDSSDNSKSVFDLQGGSSSGYYNFKGGFVDFSSLISTRSSYYNNTTTVSYTQMVKIFGSSCATSGKHNVTKMWVPNSCEYIRCGLAGRSSKSPLHIYTDAPSGKSTWYFGNDVISTDSKLTTGTAAPYIIMHFGASHDDFVNAVHE